MKLIVHKEDDALYLSLDDSEVIESEEVSDGIILDYNAEGKLLGLSCCISVSVVLILCRKFC